MKINLRTEFSTRQHMLSKDFEIYYYNDSHLTSVKQHSHQYYEFYFFVEGNIDLTIDNKKHSIKPGDFVLLPPGINHYPTILNEEKPYRRFVLWVSQEYYHLLEKQSEDYVYLKHYVETKRKYVFQNDTITFNAIQSMIFRIIEETRSSRFGKNTEVFLQLNTLILYLNRIVYEKNTNKIAHLEKALYLNICDYITDHLSEELTLERLSGTFYISKFHIAHAFKDNMGISIHQFIMKKRLHASKDGILGTLPISNIYRMYGFNDYSSFYRAFKKEYGISPKEYRQMY